MSRQNPKSAMFAGFAEVAKALGQGHRLEILELLAQGERSVEALADRAGLSIANASQHLRLMRRAGLLVSRRDGKRILYGLSDPAVLDLIAALRRVAERNLAEVRELIGGYFHERDALEPVGRGELVRRLKDGLVTVLDVRPEDEFTAGHLPNAVNIPLRDLAQRLREFLEFARSSLIVEAPTVYSPLKPWPCCVAADLRLGVLRTDIPNGRPPACPSNKRRNDLAPVSTPQKRDSRSDPLPAHCSAICS